MKYDEVYLIRNKSTEYHYMWLMLGNDLLNNKLNGKPGTPNDPTVAYNKGEAWEYTVTGFQEGQLVHCFRHRNHPKTKQREYVLVPVSKSFSLEKDCDLNRKPYLQIRKA